MNPNMRNNGHPSIQHIINQPKQDPIKYAISDDGMGRKNTRLLEMIESTITTL